MQLMKCEQCNHVQPLDMRVIELEGGIDRLYIKCNNCNDEHTCYYTNEAIRKLQAEQRLLLSKPSTRQWDKRITENKKKIKDLMDKLKAEME